MLNVLVGLVAGNYDDIWLDELLSGIKVDNCIVLARNKETASKSIVVKRYATKVFYHEQLKTGNYDNFSSDLHDAPPIDDNLLFEMSKYESQIFWMMERCVSVEYNQRWNDYCKHLRFWNNVLERYETDMFISGVPPHEVYDYIIYCLCKIKGKKFVSGMPLAYYNRFHIMTDVYDQIPEFKEIYSKNIKKYEKYNLKDIVMSDDIREMYEFYIGEEDRTPYYMTKDSCNFNSGIKRWLYRNSSMVRFAVNLKWCDETDSRVRVIYRFLERLKILFGCMISLFDYSSETYTWFETYFYKRRVFHEDNIAFDYYTSNACKVDYAQKYIYVALHMQPENTSSPLGGIYVDQALMIEKLSYYIPEDWVLYVKEHPAQIKQSFGVSSSYRALRFYKRLIACSNVKFVPLDEDTYKLIDNAQAVASLTGTVGLEAITKGVPFLMFGYSYFQYAPNVYPVRGNSDCEKAIQIILSKRKNDESYHKELKIYFKTLENFVYKTTTEGYLLKEEEKSKAQAVLADIFLKKIVEICGTSILR